MQDMQVVFGGLFGKKISEQEVKKTDTQLSPTVSHKKIQNKNILLLSAKILLDEQRSV